MVENELDEKRESMYSKYTSGESGNQLILKSNLYKVPFHYLEDSKKFVACAGDNCYFCGQGVKRGFEYNYAVLLNGQPGFMDIKSSVFFAIQDIAKAQKKEPRQISWTIVKKGKGRDTEYTVSKEDNISKEDYQVTLEELTKNNDLLAKNMVAEEQKLVKNYEELAK